MQITRFFTTAEGGSRFEDVEVGFPIASEDIFGNTLHTTQGIEAESAVLVELPAGLDQSWHQAPNRQLVFVMSGSLEVVTTEDEKRRFGVGDLFLAEDTEGKGHLTRVLDGPARVLFLHVPASFDLRALGR